MIRILCLFVVASQAYAGFKDTDCQDLCGNAYHPCMITKIPEGGFTHTCYKSGEADKCRAAMDSLSVCINFVFVEGNESIWPDFQEWKQRRLPVSTTGATEAAPTTTQAYAGFRHRDCRAKCGSGLDTCMITKTPEGDFNYICYKGGEDDKCKKELKPSSVCIDFLNEVSGNKSIWPDFEEWKQKRLPVPTTGATEAPSTINTPTTVFRKTIKPRRTTTPRRFRHARYRFVRVEIESEVPFEWNASVGSKELTELEKSIGGSERDSDNARSASAHL